jgi:hypothetical protein
VHLERVADPEAKKFFEDVYNDMGHLEADQDVDQIVIKAYHKKFGPMKFSDAVEILNKKEIA